MAKISTHQTMAVEETMGRAKKTGPVERESQWLTPEMAALLTEALLALQQGPAVRGGADQAA
jgi:hypothetical protein